MPHIRKQGNVSTYMVEDKPFIALAGELHNSSASSKEYMDEFVWPKLDGLNLNTVVAPVYWELIEPTEGTFDFESVKNLILGARKHNVKLILLWFGLWKNGLSTYIPVWAKKDQIRFPFALNKDGNPIYSVSPFAEEAINKDKLAFAELVTYLKEFDQDKQTVIGIQIENEVGILTSDFDYSHQSLEKLDQEIPLELLKKIRSEPKTWNEHFGKDSKEYFLAYHYAKAINEITLIGKEIYPLPYFVNVWLEKPAAFPGEYPLGGPTARMYSFWKEITTAIDAFGPDIYVPNFVDVCNAFSESQDVLFIPETRQDVQTVSNFLYAVANYNLICFSPFAIEDFKDADLEHSETLLHTLAIDGSAFNPKGTFPLLSKAYNIIANMWTNILEAKGKNAIYAFRKVKESDRGVIIDNGDANVRIKFSQVSSDKLIPSGFVMQVSDDEFYVVGANVNIEMKSKLDKYIGILSLEEGEFIDGKWQCRRLLNGDERYFIALKNKPSILRIVYHQY